MLVVHSFRNVVLQIQVVIVLAMWCAGLPTLMEHNPEDAVDDVYFAVLGAHILNSNMFFSAWGALIASLLLATRHYELYFKREDEKHLYHWVGFATAGLITMCETAIFWKDADCRDSEGVDVCNRSISGFILGAISCLVGFTIVLGKVRVELAQLVSGVMLVVWCIGVAYLTYNDGPGINVGIVYFASWACLLFVLAIATPACLEASHKFFAVSTTQPTTTEQGDTAPMKDDVVKEEVTKDEVVDTKAAGEEVEEVEEIAETA